MSNTKFIKVAVRERLPEKGKNVIVISSDGKSGTCYFLSGLWHGQKNGAPKYWLEEVPDRESELIEMLETVTKELEENQGYTSAITSASNHLIQSVKQQN